MGSLGLTCDQEKINFPVGITFGIPAGLNFAHVDATKSRFTVHSEERQPKFTTELSHFGLENWWKSLRDVVAVSKQELFLL
jgi:hypothetical protein